jgi:hypothetical protein
MIDRMLTSNDNSYAGNPSPATLTTIATFIYGLYLHHILCRHDMAQESTALEVWWRDVP